MEVFAEIRYKKIQQIGIGQGMNSAVYRAEDPQLGGTIAVKEIPLSKFGNSPSDYFSEAKTMFASTHRNVVPVQYACNTSAEICLAMPLYARGSLTTRIDQRPLQLLEVIRVGQGVLAGLAKIHIKSFIHFDVKPSNVLFDDYDNPLVADFGQSRTIGKNGVVAVPLMYRTALPPEVIALGVGTVVCDVYQAGLLLYRAANGDPFYKAQVPADPDEVRRRISSGKFPDRRAFQPHVPESLRRVIRKALRIDPQGRHQTATELGDHLGRVSITNDWRTEPLAGNRIRWSAARTDAPSLIVELHPGSSAGWDVVVFTESSKGKRAKNKASFWKQGLSSKDADKHLRQVFEELE